MNNRTKKMAGCGMAALMMAALLTGMTAVNTTAAEPAQTAAALLDQDANCVSVTVDLTGGWSVEFARGAFYLYDGPTDSESTAIGLTLEKEVYDEYIEAARQDEDFREEDGVISYTEEDGSRSFFLSVGDEAWFMLDTAADTDGDAVMARVHVESVSQAADTYGSEIYTDEEIGAAAVAVLEEFFSWKGCELSDLRYAGDECNSEENIQWMNQLKEGQNYTQCMELVTDFHTTADEEELKDTAWEADKEYKDYQWWLARTDGGEWELLTWGY